MADEKPDGRQLRLRLLERIHAQGASITAVANQLGISQSYLSQLLKGDKLFSTMDEAHLRAVSNYLELPAVIGFLLAGKLKQSDFEEPTVPLAAALKSALEVVAYSPPALEVCVDPTALHALPEPVKLLLVLCYQKAMGVELLTRTRRWTWTLQDRISPAD